MQSGPPSDGAHLSRRAVAALGSSIELRAVVRRLREAGVRVFTPGTDAAPDGEPAQVVLCDLASQGAVSALARYQAELAPEARKPTLVTLGSPAEAPESAAENPPWESDQNYPRPVDVVQLSEEMARLLAAPLEPSHPPPSQRGPSVPAGTTLAGQGPRLSPAPSAPRVPISSLPIPAPPRGPEGAPSSRDPAAATVPPPEAGQGVEHSAVSPELRNLLAEAERRVQAQARVENETAKSGLSVDELSAGLPPDVWDALSGPLDDELDADPELDVHLDDSPSSLPRAPDSHPLSSEAPGPEATLRPRSYERTPPGETDPNEVTSALPAVEEPDSDGGTPGPVTPAAEAPEPVNATLRRGASFQTRSTAPTLAFSEAPPSTARTVLEPTPGHLDRPLEYVSDDTVEPPPAAPPEAKSSRLELPESLSHDAAARVIGAAVRRRLSGCLSFEVDEGLRRCVLRDGDLVIAASAVHGESLVAFLSLRGDLRADTASQIEHRVPVFGRHAGAALIARGLLEQEQLWPVLRAHSEWILARLLTVERGSVRLEDPVPERLAAEPTVFGGSTGAEVVVEVVQRIIPPERAIALLGGDTSRMTAGEAPTLASECALSERMKQLVQYSQQHVLEQLQREASDEPTLPCVLYALTVLGVLRPQLSRSTPPPEPATPDRFDDDALRAHVRARRALVDEGDYFTLLGVPRGATGYDIRRSYLALRRQFDPARALRPATLDLEEDIFVITEVLEEAYEILRDQSRRERYRRAIEALPSPGFTPPTA